MSYFTRYLVVFVPFSACVFLEDSTVGREAWRVLCPSLLNKLAEFFPVVLQQDTLRDGPLCYIAVKVDRTDCLMIA